MELLNNYGKYVFNDVVMKRRLPKDVYNSFKKTRKLGKPLDAKIGETIAAAMREWAVEMGATHYVHWFQPLTDAAAGKSEGFLVPDSDGSAILEFTSSALVQGEPDASSFPSGGIRNTFEARGYTAWDPTSSVFVRDNTLFIPTVFCAYNGEALDQKTPLLRSMEAVSKEAVRVLHAIGLTDVTRVTSQVGAEQEYFLVDREKYEQRLDLKLCGRTLLGAAPPKSQELDDHYYARVRMRISEYMKDLDKELWELGIPAKTKHNEVAPTQHEIACIYDNSNTTTDANQLLMEVMKIVAKKHGLTCLLHEKPFARVNGSGKHNNFSFSTDTGLNLFSPGKNPSTNKPFILFLAAMVRSLHIYAAQYRLSTATPSNDHRLGGFEAPPAIISMFLGDPITSLLYNYGNDNVVAAERTKMQFGVQTMPELLKDDSDRNRTSPLAFTGNKFEFRMPGSSQSIAFINTVINTSMADSLEYMANRLEAAGDVDAEIKAIVKDVLENHGKIIFNGNNYSEEWVEEAQRRGLPNLKTTVDAVKVFASPETKELFSKFGVLSHAECESRYEIMMENFSKIILIECSTLLEMMRRQILPSIINCAGNNASHLASLKSVGIDNVELQEYVARLSVAMSELKRCSDKLAADISAIPTEDMLKRCEYINEIIRTDMDTIRQISDKVEQVMSISDWPIPTYTDLMHRV